MTRTRVLLAAKLIGVLLAVVSDFVPDGLRTYPDVMDDLERVAGVRDATGRHENSRGVVLTGHARSADAAEPRLPVRIGLLPRRDVLFAPNPSELFVRNQDNRDAVAPC